MRLHDDTIQDSIHGDTTIPTEDVVTLYLRAPIKESWGNLHKSSTRTTHFTIHANHVKRISIPYILVNPQIQYEYSRSSRRSLIIGELLKLCVNVFYNTISALPPLIY